MHRSNSVAALVVAALLWLARVSCATAATTVALSPAVNHPLGTFNVGGSGFGATEPVDIYFDSTDMQLAVTDSSGSFGGIQLVVPPSAAPGQHWITAIGRRTVVAAQSVFTVRTDWSALHFGVRRRGLNPYENVIGAGNAARLDVAWIKATQNVIGYSSPAVANGVVYVGSEDDMLYAFDATSGALLSGWPVATGNAVDSSPAVANGIVYVGSQDEKLYAFDATSGALLSGWPVSTGGRIFSSPAVANGIVYVGSQDDKLYAFHARSGAPLSGWPVTTGGPIYSSPAVANGVVYVGSDDDKLYAFDSKSGAQLSGWPATTGGSITLSSPAVANGVVYVGSFDGKVYAFNARSGAVLAGWPQTTADIIESTPAVANGVVYVGSDDHKLYAYDSISGVSLPGWPITTGGGASSPAVANGIVYVGSGDKLYAYNALSGARLWGAATGAGIGSSPAVVNGMIYVGSGDHNLYAYALDAGNNAAYRADRPAPAPSSLHPDPSLSPWKRKVAPQTAE